MFTKNQINSLKALANQVMNLFQLRKSKAQIEENNKKLQNFCDSASEQVVESTSNIQNLAKILVRTEVEFDDRALEIIKMLKYSANDLKLMIQELYKNN